MLLLFLIVLGVVGYIILKAYVSSGIPRQSEGSSGTSRNAIPNWLQERWDLADKIGAGEIFPSWYFDQMTEFQSRRLEEDGRKYSGRLTKGQASDLIGLDEQPEEDDIEVLKFFKRPLRGMNASLARHEIAMIFQDPQNKQAWADRPLTARQKECFKFFGIKVTPQLLKREADLQITELLQQANTANDPKYDQWHSYEYILDDFNDPEFREGYSIRKPSIAAIRKAIDSLLTEGKTWSDIDSDLVAERVVELDPNLER